MWNPFKKKSVEKAVVEERPRQEECPHLEERSGVQLPSEALWLDDSVKINLRHPKSDEELLGWLENGYNAGLKYANVIPGAQEKLEDRRKYIEELKARIAASKGKTFEPQDGHYPRLSAEFEKRSPKYRTDQEMMEAYGKASYVGYKTDKWDDARRVFEELEAEGFPEASVALGQLSQGTDVQSAKSHFRRAAEKSAEAAWGYAANLGHSYIADIDGDDKEWYRYCLLAAKGGNSDAMNELGNMYNRRVNYLGAFYWYYMAAFYEHPQGWQGVAGELQKWQKDGMPNLDDKIDGVSKSETLAVKHVVEALRYKNLNFLILMHLAMEDDNEFAGLFIGHMCEQNNDWERAKQGFQFAAHNKKSVMAKKCLGDMLAYGKGCDADLGKSLEWYKAAAELGEKSALFIYGQFVARRNPAEAVYWLACAYRRGYMPALDFITKKILL